MHTALVSVPSSLNHLWYTFVIPVEAGRSEAQSHPPLYSKLETNMGYMRLSKHSLYTVGYCDKSQNSGFLAWPLVAQLSLPPTPEHIRKDYVLIITFFFFLILPTLEDASDGAEKHPWPRGFEQELKPETLKSPGHRILRTAGPGNMAVSLDDDVPLILTLDEGESAPLAPSNGLAQEELPSKSKLGGRWVGGARTTSAGE